jgi:hypothetical protein
MADTERERERVSASVVTLSTDLIAAARKQVALLEAIDRAPELHNHSARQHAARR